MVGNTVKVSENAPDWLKSLEKGQAAACILQDASQKKAFSAVEDGVAPILEDEAGNVIMAEKKVGNGSVLFCTVALANTEMFQDSFMSKLLSDYVDSRGIARTVTYDPEKFHVVHAGFDAIVSNYKHWYLPQLWETWDYYYGNDLWAWERTVT